MLLERVEDVFATIDAMPVADLRQDDFEILDPRNGRLTTAGPNNPFGATMFACERDRMQLAQIDDDIVSSYMPRFEREDFVAHVFRGEEISRYTDCSGAIDELDDEDDDHEI